MPAAADTPSTTTTTTVPPTKAARRKPARLLRRRAGHPHEEDDDAETVGSDDSYSDDSGLSEEEGFSDCESDDEFEDASDGEGRQAAVEKPATKQRTDTDLMINGIAPHGGKAETVEFEEMGRERTVANGKRKEEEEEETVDGEVEETVVEEVQRQEPKKHLTPYERRQREHEEYKKRRAEDPSFVPNRGRFFMHDSRDNAGGNGFRPFGPGGKGRGGRFGNREFQPHHQAPPPPELAGEWLHDMHEQIETQVEQQQQQRPAPASAQSHQQQQNQGHNNNNNFAAGRQRAPDQPRSFGRTLHKGTVQIQVNLPGMKAPITFSEVPCKVYTRLPFHRPPLRRDKPVRIALPESPVRYIYPNVQRSFIFIPRAMRPGGSGYIRGAAGRGRGGYSQGGRSFYGGGSTIYSPSVDMSRRSSLVYDTRHHTPAQAMHPQAGHAPTPRLATQQPPPSYTPSYTPAMIPAPYREARATPKIPMYQPRPQKAVNVAEIDSPAVMHFPSNYSGGIYTDHVPSGTPPQHMQQHNRHPSYTSQAPGTPLSQIPEAVHARPFQPNPYPQQQQPYYQQYPPPHAPQQNPMPHPQHAPMQPHHGVFHPPPPPYVAGPSPMPNGPTNHYIPQSMQPHQPPPPLQQVPGPAPPGPSGPTTIAQESNGMVYYSTWDPNTTYYQYPPAPGPTYADAPVMTMTPGPDGQGQNVGGTMYYYP
ncbi:CASC3/Barentsz eIF4AIII binding-domain-containing protein, partial [Tricharina praecox]|uniref:CASC3/Barentsz eIF4AIII binding-domain-containing protein n=1 Tax=Tricharina praecox TaxID=43433 RepID=UPI00221ECB86